MSLTRAAIVAPSARAISQGQDRPAEPTLPPHVQTFLGMIRTHFDASRDARIWDQHDTRAYGKVVLKLSGSECRILMDRLRAKHHWRPSVAQVQEALDELLEKTAPERVLTGAEVAMRTVHTMPRALPSAANGPHREAARREIARRRAQASLVPVAERKAENQAPASVPVSWVGMLVVALVDGKDVRGVVWSEEGDTLTIKAGAGHKFTVDKAFVRVELARERGGLA